MIDLVIEAVLVGEVKPLGERRAPSGIDKKIVSGAQAFNELGLINDAQGDLKSHGGVDKSIHHYPFDHYQHWLKDVDTVAEGYQGPSLQVAGAFGENISTVGITEKDVCLGDIFQLGSGVVQLVQGRQPCWKLNERFGLKTMSRDVQKTGRTGWYYRVLEDGTVEEGSRFRLIERPEPDWNLARIVELLYVDVKNFAALSELVKVPHLADNWRVLAERRLAKGEVEDWGRRLDGVSSAKA